MSRMADDEREYRRENQIVIVDGGWVFMGDVEVGDKLVVITNAQNIRKWGTTRGLGEIAQSGPTQATQLDDYGDVTIPIHACKGFIKCHW